MTEPQNFINGLIPDPYSLREIVLNVELIEQTPILCQYLSLCYKANIASFSILGAHY